MTDYKKRPRADKYEKKLKINASFEDAMGVLLGKKPKSIKMTITNEWSPVGTPVEYGKDIHILYKKWGFSIEIKSFDGTAIIRQLESRNYQSLEEQHIEENIEKEYVIYFTEYSHIKPASISFKTDSGEMEISVKYV